MIQRLLLTVLFLFAPFVHAQSFVPKPPPCWTGLLGDGVGYYSGYHGDPALNHIWFGWHCPTKDGFDWFTYVGAKRGDHALRSPTISPTASAASQAEAWWMLNTNMDCSDTAIKSICDTGKARMALIDKPEPPVYVVAPLSGQTTRPVYAFDQATKTRGDRALTGIRAPVGVTCVCWASGVREGKTAWCMWEAAVKTSSLPNRVTMCARKQ